MVQYILNEYSEPTPLVVVEGFLSSSDKKYWYNFLKCQTELNIKPRRVIFVKLGPLSSTHDRCCELYYQLKGGIVDYGKQHSKQMGHKRYGKYYIGLYPKWSEKFPLHILGHSLGGLTCIRFQHMLHNKIFSNLTNENWIKSITTFSTPHRGSTLPYMLGTTEGNIQKVNLFSIGAFIYRFAYLISWLNLNTHNLNLEHWELYKLPWYTFLNNLIFNFQFDKSKDNAASDLTIESCEQYNIKYSKLYKNIYYRSYAASMCNKSTQYYYPTLKPDRSIITLLFSTLMGIFNFKCLNYDSKQWRQNDGVVPTKSQYHPNECNINNCIHIKYNKVKKGFKKSLIQTIQSSIWYTIELQDACHFNVIRSKYNLSKEHNLLLKDIWMYLDQIDKKGSKKLDIKEIYCKV